MTKQIIDPSVFAELSDTMGEDFATELVSTFLDEAPLMFRALEDAATQADADAFRRAAHSLKSNAEVFGAGQLAQMARALEMGGLPDDASSLTGLRTSLAETTDALGKLIHV